METKHRFIFEDSRSLFAVSDQSIDLVVTSPPYPMIKMWDEQFAAINPELALLLESGNYSRAYEAMHSELDKTWQELYRVMKAGALACINIGDATRTINKRFQLFTNHARIQKKFFDLGFDVLPLIVWRKQTNAPNKFMGSGMLPAGAYTTLEHEYILIFRKGNKRLFRSEEEKQNRRKSAYFWEERNTWFSDLWDLKGVRQETKNRELRKRSAAFPFMLPFRLVNMYSVFGDKILDPFSGTGTTALAAMAAGRNSVSLEVDGGFSFSVRERISQELPGLARYNLDRIAKHLEFVHDYQGRKGSMKYINSYFGFPVMTNQETDLKLAFAGPVEEADSSSFRVKYYEDQYVKEKNLAAYPPIDFQVFSSVFFPGK